MSFEKGWINRQFVRIERESKNWPEWMNGEPAVNSSEAMEAARPPNAADESVSAAAKISAAAHKDD